MARSFESLLESHHSRIPYQWKAFVQRSESPYRDERDAWNSYAHGFKLAADSVAKDCYENYPRRQVLYAPIFFLYRYWLELRLKSIWKGYEHRGWISTELKYDHKILPLWLTVKAVSVERDVISEDDEFVGNVEKSIHLLSSVDALSQYSRYPEGPPGQRHDINFDLEEFITAIDDIETVFFGLSAMVDQYDYADGITP